MSLLAFFILLGIVQDERANLDMIYVMTPLFVIEFIALVVFFFLVSKLNILGELEAHIKL